MRTIVVFVFLMGTCFLAAQKMVVKTIEDTNISFIQIDAKNCYTVALETVDIPNITVVGAMDGEYLQNLLVNVKQEGTSLLVNTGFQPNFILPNDKLSTHKVVSISLKISIPKYLNVLLYGTSTNVDVTGEYGDLKISLSDGRCVFEGAGENVSVSTLSGNIDLITKNADILAITKYGQINREAISSGDNHFSLNSVSGHINIRKTE
ncbi:hypothetical protein H4O18_01465 [Arenibacter sp. BSSL-BM3]|uniref:Adhesin domain-containing protein n=1 Tax=Arenibacter arenosicollis TaxID=2762274 RepID=A0ABR7QI75_9FLAO|nr:hypothetical protein [Arenibacter arenosicollis]MBC8766650.1 hypothetical protein [Arenibacter arenosicollis]